MAIIRSLAKQFRSFGVFYNQIERSGDAAVYSLRCGEHSPIIGYDCILVQSSTLEQLNALVSLHSGTNIKKYDGAPDDRIERYPHSGLWGSAAWSFNSLPAAREKYFQLIKAEKLKTIEQVSGYESKPEPAFTVKE